MKFSCNKNSLLNEIAIAQGIISSRNTMSILSNVLLEVKEGNLYIKATDLKIGYETYIPVNMEEPGSTTVYCDKFLGVLRTFPDGDVKFNLTGDKLTVDSESGDTNIQLKVIEADNYPELIKIEDDKYFEAIINKGLPQISQKNLPNLIEYYEDESTKAFTKPFVIDAGWLFATKYFNCFYIYFNNLLHT